MIKTITTIGGVEVFYDGEADAVYFTAPLRIDADGGAHTYHPDGAPGRDFLANAGHPGNWWALACDGHGNPYVQGDSDPAPGFYVSTTALENPEYGVMDPQRYVDAETVPYIVLPSSWEALTGLHVPLGTVWSVKNLVSQHFTEAVYADVGPKGQLGEGSPALADHIGVPPDPKHGGTDRPVILYTLPNASQYFKKG